MCPWDSGRKYWHHPEAVSDPCVARLGGTITSHEDFACALPLLVLLVCSSSVSGNAIILKMARCCMQEQGTARGLHPHMAEYRGFGP